MDGVMTIALLKEYIQNSNDVDLKETLAKLPLESISVGASDKLLAELLNTCKNYERGRLALMIYNRWKTSNPEEGNFSLYTYMFTKTIFTDSVLSMLGGILQETSLTLFDQLKKRDDSDEHKVALARIFHILGLPDYTKLEEMLTDVKKLEFDEDVSAPRMRSLLEDHIKEKSPFAEKPKYIIISKDFDYIPDDYEIENIAVESDVDIDSLNDDQKIDLMTRGMDSLGLTTSDIDKTKETLRKEILTMDKVDQKVLLIPILKQLDFAGLTENPELFKTFGPSHISVGFDINDSETAHPCSRYGGCRMLLCICILNISNIDDQDYFDLPDEDPNEVEWFRESCDFCNKRIAKKCYAFRRPNDTGGWYGCFCSFKCARDDVPVFEENNNAVTIFALIDKFEKEINKQGIYDREYPKE